MLIFLQKLFYNDDKIDCFCLHNGKYFIKELNSHKIRMKYFRKIFPEIVHFVRCQYREFIVTVYIADLEILIESILLLIVLLSMIRKQRSQLPYIILPFFHLQL